MAVTPWIRLSGLSTMLAIGPDQFKDRCWQAFTRWTSTSSTTESSQVNLPVIMGLLTVWYNDFFNAQTVAVLPS